LRAISGLAVRRVDRTKISPCVRLLKDFNLWAVVGPIKVPPDSPDGCSISAS